MPKPLLPITTLFLILFALAALLACNGTTPAPDPTETPVPANIAASTATPASSPTPEPTTTPALDGRLAPILLQDSRSLQSALSDSELSCIGDDPEYLAFALTGPGPESKEEQVRLLDCLHDETLARLFLAGFVPGPDPLTLEASDCVREGLEVIDPRSVMMAGIEEDPGRAMAKSMAAMIVTVSCLTDDEWNSLAPKTVVGHQEREGMQCLMQELGGPGGMAAVVMASQAVHFATYKTAEEALAAAEEADEVLEAASATCEMKMGTATGQAPGTPPPSPTATAEPSTPVPTPTTTTAPLTPAPTAIATSKSTTTLVITVAEVPAGIPEYDRGEWRHWTDEDGDCQDTRQEVLVVESLVEVTYEDDRECRVEWGRWWAPHLGHHLENPGHLDVEHHVPLKNAHLSGGWAWDSERKEQHANYLEDPAHLVAISARHNRSKGARGPEEWAPPDKGGGSQKHQGDRP